jgi:hypothetical protein
MFTPAQAAALATKSKFNLVATVANLRDDGRFRFDAFAIGLTDEPFMTVSVKAPNLKRAQRLARMKVQAKMPGGREYVSGGGMAA